MEGVVTSRRSSQSNLSLLRFLQFLGQRNSAWMLVGAFLYYLLRKLQRWQKGRREHEDWRRHADFSVVQACILSTEHLHSLGRIEKRTLFVKPIAEVFKNEYILGKVLTSANKAAVSHDAFLPALLSEEDKWHVLNTCMNHLSSCFAPYHVFFNEARRVKSYYNSAWYCFTLTCSQTEAPGRWFVTPRKPVSKDDVGMLRIRIIMMNESELRDVASGAIEPPIQGFFNGRQRSRWELVCRFAECFERQLRAKDDDVDVSSPRNSIGLGMGFGSSMDLRSRVHQQTEATCTREYEPEDNQVLRLHVPFPTSTSRAERKEMEDVVLYE